MYNVVVNILTVLIYVDVLAVLSSAHSLIFFLSLLSVSCTGLHLQPLSSTSCLCKDPATAVVSIVSVQTPWCHGIHSLLSVPPEEAGEQRTMRCHFLNPFVLFYTFFFCPTGAFFSSLLLILFFGKAVLISHKMFLSSSPSKSHCLIGFFFIITGFHSGTLMEGNMGYR